MYMSISILYIYVNIIYMLPSMYEYYTYICIDTHFCNMLLRVLVYFATFWSMYIHTARKMHKMTHCGSSALIYNK